jgi:hypothetical protein
MKHTWEIHTKLEESDHLGGLVYRQKIFLKICGKHSIFIGQSPAEGSF